MRAPRQRSRDMCDATHIRAVIATVASHSHAAAHFVGGSACGRHTGSGRVIGRAVREGARHIGHQAKHREPNCTGESPHGGSFIAGYHRRDADGEVLLPNGARIGFNAQAGR
jgi:hypothetical protein